MSVELKICLPIFIVLELSFFSSIAQRQVRGKITGNSEILVSATVRNISQSRTNISDIGGNYKIGAETGDTLVFSHQGYYPDTLVVTSTMFYEPQPVDLTVKISYLHSVDVDEMAKYRMDSINRKNDYADIYGKKKQKLVDYKPADGSAVSFSPIGHFVPSTDDKEKRKLKKRLEEDDKDEYIYYKFSNRVPKLTGLHGDTLILFVNKYKPSYDFCLNSTSMDMLVYINDKFILFKEGNYK